MRIKPVCLKIFRFCLCSLNSRTRITAMSDEIVGQKKPHTTNKHKKTSWYSSGYCKLQFCNTYWTTNIIHWCFKDVGIILSIECVISLRGRRADMLLGDRVLKKWFCIRVTNILSLIWKEQSFCLHGNLYCAAVFDFQLCSTNRIW